MKKLSIFLLSIFASSQLMGTDIVWSYPPTSISTANVNASDAHIAMDANGDVVAVWIENGVVKSKSKTVNMSWSTEHSLSASTVSSPRVVSDASFNATAIWIENGVVKASYKPSSGNWSNEVTLSNSGASTPTLAVDSTGDVVAAWARNGNIETAIKIFGQNWGPVQTINSSNATNPYVAAGGSCSGERAVVVWNGTSGTTNVVYASTKLIGSNWSNQTLISVTNHQAGYASVAIDPNCNATAVWYLYDVSGSVYSNVTVQSATLPSGGAWTTPQSLSVPGIRNPATLSARVAYDGFANAIAIWNTSFDDETFHIQSAIKPVQGGWQAPYELVSGNLYSFNYSQTVSSLGDAIAVYMFYNGSSLLIQSSETDITGFTQAAWSVPINISTGTENAYPSLASALTGNLINTAAVWIASNGTVNSVVAATGTKNLILPPSSPTVTQSTHNFGVFTEYYNTLSWTASTDPNVAGYLIYRNGTFIGQVNAGTLHFVDDNRVQNGSVIYGVASVDSQQSHSKIITVSFP